MRYFLVLDLDNAAFAEDPGAEAARILREAASRVEGYAFDHQNSGCRFPLRDINGNRVGTHGYTGSRDDGAED
jgi:hypothetical protein